MKKTFRRALFWFLVFLFVATTPIAILYSQGYRFDQKGMIFVHSGAITVKSLPADIEVFLDGKPQSTKNLDIINSSVTVGGLRPGNYDLKLGSNGYGEWKKNVEVHSGLSTEFWNVVLAPQNLATKEMESRNVGRFFPSPFGKKTAYLEKKEAGISLWHTDFSENETRLVFSGDDATFQEDEFENLEWNFKEDLLLVPVVRNGKSDYLVASSEENLEPLYLSEAEKTEGIKKARWSPKEKNVVYFLAKETHSENHGLYKLDLESRSPELVVPEAAAYDFSQDSVYFIQKSNILFKSDLDGKNVSQVNDNSFSDRPAGEKARLIVYDETRQVLVSEEKDLFVHNEGVGNLFQKIGSNIESVQFSDDGKKLLFWTENEISVMFLREWEVQPYRQENEIQTIIRFSGPIKNVFWYKDYEHVFFSIGKKIKLIELDPRDRRICLDIFENNLEEFPAAYDVKNGYYYFAKSMSGERKIFYFPFPEKTGIFG